MDKSIRKIVTLMEDMEGSPMPGVASVVDAMGDVAMGMMPGDSPDQGIPDECAEECGVSPEVLDLARELVVQAGSADKAREVIDKVDEVMDLLGDVVDGGSEADAIMQFADSLPDELDLPNNRHNVLGMSAMFDPSHIG
jgi:hypothetical protein